MTFLRDLLFTPRVNCRAMTRPLVFMVKWGRLLHFRCLSTSTKPVRGIQLELNPANGPAYDQVIDVRTPAEFADDHLPGAVNLPLLDDVDRATVGKTFAESPFEARRIGASLISRRIGQLLDGYFADKGLDYRPLIYCWRGGQRSQSLALVLSQIGYSPAVLSGGYRAYRRMIVEETARLATSGLPRMVVLTGLTGSGKTYWLGQLAKRGEQVVDLESLANHKGSILGHDLNSYSDGQPTQKSFESALHRHLRSVEPLRPVWLECESVKIGRRFLPQALAARMRAAPRVLLEAPSAEDRVQRLCREYADWSDRPAELLKCLRWLGGKHQSEGTLARWLTAAESGNTAMLVRQLLRDHYDPTYCHSRERFFLETDPARVTRVQATAEFGDGDESERVDQTARRLIEAGARLTSADFETNGKRPSDAGSSLLANG